MPHYNPNPVLINSAQLDEPLKKAIVACHASKDILADMPMDCDTMCKHGCENCDDCTPDTFMTREELDKIEKNLKSITEIFELPFLTTDNRLIATRIAEALNTIHRASNLHLALAALENII